MRREEREEERELAPQEAPRVFWFVVVLAFFLVSPLPDERLERELRLRLGLWPEDPPERGKSDLMIGVFPAKRVRRRELKLPS